MKALTIKSLILLKMLIFIIIH